MNINQEFGAEINTKRISTIFLEGIFSGCLSITASILLARFMSTKSYGLYASSISLLTIFALFCNLGLPNVATKLYRALLESTKIDPREVRGVNYISPILIALVSLIAATGLIIIKSADGRSDEASFWGFTGIIILLPIVCINNYLFNFATATGGGLRSNLIQGWGGQVLSIGSIILAHFIAKSSLDVLTVATVHGIVLITQLILLKLLTKSIEPKYLKTGEKIIRIRKWISEGLPFSTASLGTSIFFSAGVVIIGFALNDQQSAAKLAVASTLASILISVHLGVFSIFYPLLVEATTAKNKFIISRLNWYWMRSWIIFVTPFMTAGVLFGKSLLQVFGSEYIAAYPAMLTLSMGYIIFILGQPLQVSYQFSGKSLEFTKYTYVFAGIAIAGMLIVGENASITDVAIISMLLLNTRTVIVVWQARRIIVQWA